MRDYAIYRFLASVVRVSFFDDAKSLWLISTSCLVLFASMWLVLSPGVVYSIVMTWDLLFNLDGAWRLYSGQVLHVDFHHPLGTLPFAMTALGFQLIGIKPIAFVVGECVLATTLAVLAISAVKDRLPTLPGCLFVSICILLVLAPVAIGDQANQFTFAMGYNRFGWSAISILCLLLFIEPRGQRDQVWTDLVVGAILIVGLWYLKITYFAVGVAAVALALLTSHHIRRHWLRWCGLLLLIVLLSCAPMNDGYRTDILSAIASGNVHSGRGVLVRLFVFNGAEQIWVLAEIIILLYLASERHATPSDVLIGFFIWISGFFLLSQNAQGAGIPLFIVLALLLYVRLVSWLQSTTYQPLTLVPCLMTCALLPLLPVLISTGLTLITYNYRARQSAHTFIVMENRLRGLTVPKDEDNVLDEVAADRYSRDSFSRIRSDGPRVHELTQNEYVKTILELADVLRKRGTAAARIVLIDQVNPLPFILGTVPPRGGSLWLGDGAWQPSEREFQEADYVAIPRFPTLRATTIEGLEAYGGYLSTQFSQRYETPYWTLLERRNAVE
jgi:hypothetical protein